MALKQQDERDISPALIDCIQNEIKKQQGCIPFATYMELALYHPELGYYCSTGFDVGAHGDFTTAPEISPLFANSLTKPITHIMEMTGHTEVLELGAGTGKLASNLLTALTKQSCLPNRYLIYEISPHLRKQQQLFLQTAHPEYFSRITWLDVLPSGFKGIILANEVLDALPVHRFRIEDNHVHERGVGWEKNQFIWKSYTTPSSALMQQADSIRELCSLPNGYESEINLHANRLILALAHSLKQGVILLIDYGYGQQEYYHPERRQGTLTCFYKHHQHHNPFLWPGLQDITAHVNFTQVVQTAVLAGCALHGYTSQSSFLLSCDLIHWISDAEKCLSPAEIINLHHAVKLLVLPTEMGERTKVMALSKGLEMQSLLPGFTGHDRRRDL